ncbi:flagellin, partial [Arthrobacter sp. zg-Y877]|uniref:flagellin n=1 Tax=Arthrobacter sp. zg-Y877 TaxID=3049074 RepID=UPI0025A475DC
QDGISLIQTAEGALTEVHNILNRVRDLSVQAANDTNNTDSRAAIEKEVTALTDELTRISESTNFNGIQLLGKAAGAAETDTFGDTLKVHVGAAADETISIKLTDVAKIVDTLTTTGGVDGAAFDVKTQLGAEAAITALDTAITAISTGRADLGAQQNRLESTARTIAVSVENLSSANSRIRDTDMAAEMGSFTKSQILSQAATAMLAQANQMNSGVMQLLQ